MFNKVVVGVDEHQGGHDAVALAKRLAAPAGEVTLAHIHRIVSEPFTETGPNEDACVSKPEPEILAEAFAVAAEKGSI